MYTLHFVLFALYKIYIHRLEEEVCPFHFSVVHLIKAYFIFHLHILFWLIHIWIGCGTKWYLQSYQILASITKICTFAQRIALRQHSEKKMRIQLTYSEPSIYKKQSGKFRDSLDRFLLVWTGSCHRSCDLCKYSIGSQCHRVEQQPSCQSTAQLLHYCIWLIYFWSEHGMFQNSGADTGRTVGLFYISASLTVQHVDVFIHKIIGYCNITLSNAQY